MTTISGRAPANFRLDVVTGPSVHFIGVPPRLQSGARKRTFDEIGRGIELRITLHVSLADFAGERLHVGDQFGAQGNLGGVRAALRLKYFFPAFSSQTTRVRKRTRRAASAMRSAAQTQTPEHTASCSSSSQPIFFRKRSAQTQKRNTAMPDMMASDCQYSKKFAPRRMMARMRAMK